MRYKVKITPTGCCKEGLFLPLRTHIWLTVGDVPKHKEQVKKRQQQKGARNVLLEFCLMEPRRIPRLWNSFIRLFIYLILLRFFFLPFIQHLLLEALICTLLLWWPEWQLRCQEVWLFWGPCTVNHKRFSVGPYFLSLKSLRDHFSYFGDAESHKTHKRPSHCRD